MSEVIENVDINKVTAYTSIPYAVISSELQGTIKSEFQVELNHIKGYYDFYEKGSNFVPDSSDGSYVPSTLRYKKARSIIDKEARFLFSKTPDFKVVVDSKNKNNTELQDFLDLVLKKNNFSSELLKASKDCFIGKRVACFVNFNEEKGITVSFVNPLEFYYETSGSDTRNLTKIIAFYNTVKSRNAAERRVFKKKYELKNGVCYLTEVIYDGSGKVIEELCVDVNTGLTFIPAVVIINEGLVGDIRGESEMEYLDAYEAEYSRLANADIDAGRKTMNPIRYTIDANPDSTSNLTTKPGAFWDIESDPNNQNDNKAQIGMLESSMAYSEPLKTTLDRIDTMMHEQTDVPNVNSEQLQGVITSGKTLKALYWGLIVRCDEKMLVWRPALEFIATTIIEGAKVFPVVFKHYDISGLPDLEYEVNVENNYPLPEDEVEEKTMDLAEVSSQTMSRKAYMKKWRNLNDDEVNEELRQIALESQLLNDTYVQLEKTQTGASEESEDDLVGNNDGNEEDVTNMN